jgi:hypothetical protein
MGQILVEVVPPTAAASSGDLGPRKPAVPEEFSSRAAEIADSIGNMAQQFRAQLEKRAGPEADAAAGQRHWGLGEVELGFQLAIQAEAGMIVAKATSGATFSVKLLWKAGPEVR